MAELHVVVKGTKSIDEFKAVNKDMQDKANRYADEHLHSYESHDNWQEGEPVKAWYDADEIFCIEYKSGRWWHYQETAEGLQWW